MINRKIYFLSLFLFCLACGHSEIKNQSRFSKQNSGLENKKNKISISFIGDILVHKTLYQAVVNSDDKKFSRLWKKAIPFFESVDYSYGNLEGPAALGLSDQLQNKGDIGFVYDGQIYSGENMLFNYHPQIIDDIKDSGIDIVSTANNHTLDRGPLGVDKTVDALRSKGLNFIGTRKKGEKEKGLFAYFYQITQIKNFKVAWISCTEALNGFKDRESQVLLCYDQAKQIVSLIQKLKIDEQVDIVIVTPHWGVEYKSKPHTLQKTHAHLFLNAGADVIIGSHPHVLQPVEQYKTQDGRNTVIAYSLGNFVSGQLGLEKQSSAIIFLEFEKNQRLSWISNYNYQPITFNLNRKNPELILPEEKSVISLHIESLISKKFIPLAKSSP